MPPRLEAVTVACWPSKPTGSTTRSEGTATTLSAVSGSEKLSRTAVMVPARASLSVMEDSRSPAALTVVLPASKIPSPCEFSAVPFLRRVPGPEKETTSRAPSSW